MKTLKCLTFILIISSINITFSQTQDTSASKNYLKGGKWALQFDLGAFINPTYFKSIELGIKSQLSTRSAVRLGIGFNLSSSDGELNSYSYNTPETRKDYQFAFSLNYLYYLNPKDVVCFYGGIGPVYEYYESGSDEVNKGESQGIIFTSEHHRSARSWYIGLEGIVGVEWFLHERICILGEYNLIFKRGKYSSTTTDIFSSTELPTEIIVRNQNSNSLSFHFNIVKIGLSAYF
jgi:opacity protein-like surface antigen